MAARGTAAAGAASCVSLTWGVKCSASPSRPVISMKRALTLNPQPSTFHAMPHDSHEHRDAVFPAEFLAVAAIATRVVDRHLDDLKSGSHQPGSNLRVESPPVGGERNRVERGSPDNLVAGLH